MAMQQFIGRAIDRNGGARSKAVITVRVKSSGALASIYSDEGITPKTNPMTVTSNGSFFFYAANGNYTVTDDLGFLLGDVALFAPDLDEEYVIKADGLPVKNADTTLENDSTLKFDIGANENWEFTLAGLLYRGATNTGFKWDFTIPAGAVFTNKCAAMYDKSVPSPTNVNGYNSELDTTDSVAGYSGSLVEPRQFYVRGVILNGANAGTVQLRYAQNNSWATNTYLAAGSWLIARKIV